MSFRIFAAGSNKFHFEQDKCIDDSDINMVELISKFQTMEPTWKGVGTTGADIVLPSKGIIDLMQTMATMEFLHNLSNAVSFLAMCSGSSDGWISVSARETHLLWPDTMAIAKYQFYPGNSPGTEFIKKISPVLKKTDMANWGVLRMLGIALGKYSNHIDSSATPMINIQLTS
ncbi:MAG: hypothetical protein KF855_07770 [Acidobacteria bacterium]|nr:hypothetical protein [Acidobacteriota bacterium]